MTTLLQIKPYIHDFIEENLDSSFSNKVYWIGERRNVPEYPYCLLSVIAENKDKRTSTHKGELVEILESGEITGNFYREKIITRYKTCTITVAVYNGWTGNTTDEDMNMDEAKEFAYEQIDNLEGAFEDYPINSKFSVQNISPIRPLHEVVDGGYMYRYEFDLTIGYNEPQTKLNDYGKQVNAIIKANNEDAINFTVAIENNDNISIETI